MALFNAQINMQMLSVILWNLKTCTAQIWSTYPFSGISCVDDFSSKPHPRLSLGTFVHLAKTAADNLIW